MKVIKKKYPILDENGQPSTFPNFGSQVFGDDDNARPLWQDGSGFHADNSDKLGGIVASSYALKTDIPAAKEIDYLKVYPIGSIYLSLNEVDPGDLFGGKWIKLTDAFLIGAGNDYALGSSGGETSHLHAFTDDSIAAIGLTSAGIGFKGANGASYQTTRVWQGSTVEHSIDATGGSQLFGGTKESSNMPPWLAVNIWHRIS